ncbi:MAG: adenylate/guanylate cyclase domain-containing protein [archaeon]|nr:adenylate/guanylate cyclase domain-containing protein [archaeon]
MSEEKHYNTTVLFIDMAGYTYKTSKLSRNELKKVLEEFESVVSPVIKNFGGRIIKGMGDAYLVTFHSPTNSILCGTEIQKRLKERNERVNENEKFEARIGISSGEVYERGADIFGEPVNIASRIQSKAKPGDILFGESVYYAMNKNEIKYHPIGKHSLKGIDEKIGIYQVKTKNRGFFSRIKSFFSRYKWWIIVILLIFFILAANGGNKNGKNSVQQEKIINDAWYKETQTIFDGGEKDTTTIEKLINIYERAHAEERTLQANSFASLLYVLLERYTSSYEAIKTAMNQANIPLEKRQVINLAEKLVTAYPEGSSEKEKLQILIDNYYLKN